MSQIKRTVDQKASFAQASEAALVPNDPFIVITATDASEKSPDPIQAVNQEFTETHAAVTEDARSDFSTHLVELAEEFHAQAVAMSAEQIANPILLAQAQQGSDKDNAAGALSTEDDDGVLGTAGWAGLIGLGVLAAAGGGGGGGGTSNGDSGNGPSPIDLGVYNNGNLININSPNLNYVGNGRNVISNFDINTKLTLPQDIYVYDSTVFSENLLHEFSVVKGVYSSSNEFTVSSSGEDYLLTWYASETNKCQYVVLDLDSSVISSSTNLKIFTAQNTAVVI